MNAACRSMSERTECTERWMFIPLVTSSDIAIHLFLLWECLSFFFVSFWSPFPPQGKPEGNGSHLHS